MGDPPTLRPLPATRPKKLPAQVPRRFPIRTMMGFVALFAVLLSVLRTLGMPPTIMVILGGWVLAIAAAQAFLLKGRFPREASALFHGLVLQSLPHYRIRIPG